MVLGEKAALRKWEAETEASRDCRRRPQAKDAAQGSNAGLVHSRTICSVATREVGSQHARDKQLHFKRHILPGLGAVPLADIDKFQCQLLLNQLAERKFSLTIVNHTRIMLKPILEEAIDADLILKNPTCERAT